MAKESEFREGQTATHPTTGHKIIYTNGEWQDVGEYKKNQTAINPKTGEKMIYKNDEWTSLPDEQKPAPEKTNFLKEYVARPAAIAAKNITQGVVGGAADLLRLGLDPLQNLAANKLNIPSLRPPTESTSEMIGRGFDTATGDLTTPRDQVERIAQTAGQFLGSGLTGAIVKGGAKIGQLVSTGMQGAKSPLTTNAATRTADFLSANKPLEVAGLGAAGLTAGVVNESPESSTATKIAAPLAAGVAPSLGLSALRGGLKGLSLAIQPTKLLASINRDENLKKEVINAAKEEGIKLPPSAITENSLINFLESKIAQSNLSGEGYKNLVKNVDKDFIKQYGESLNQVSPTKFANEQEAGERLGATLKNEMGKSERETSEAYEALNKHYGTEIPEFDKTSQTIDNVLEKLGKNNDLTDPETAKVASILQRVKNRVQQIPEAVEPTSDIDNKVNTLNQRGQIFDNEIDNLKQDLLRKTSEIEGTKKYPIQDMEAAHNQKILSDRKIQDLEQQLKGNRLSDFIIKRGGLRISNAQGTKKTSDFGDLRAGDISNKTRVGLFNDKKGWGADVMLNAAEQAGYFPRGASVEDFKEALQADLHGEHHYPINDIRSKQLEQLREHNAQVEGFFDDETLKEMDKYKGLKERLSQFEQKKQEIHAEKQKALNEMLNTPHAGQERTLPRLNIQDALELITDLGKSAKYGNVDAGVLKLLRPLRRSIQEDLQSFGTKDKTFQSLYENATNKARFSIGTFRNELMKSMMKQETPEKLIDMIRTPSDVIKLERAAGKEMMPIVQQVKRLKLENILGKNFTQNEAGDLVPKYGSIATSLQDIQKNNNLIRSLVGEQTYNKLQNLRVIAKAMAEKNKIYNPSNTANSLLDTGYMVGMGSSLFVNPALGVGMLVAPRLTSRIITSPKLVDHLTKGLRAEMGGKKAVADKYRNEFVTELGKISSNVGKNINTVDNSQGNDNQAIQNES